MQARNAASPQAGDHRSLASFDNEARPPTTRSRSTAATSRTVFIGSENEFVYDFFHYRELNRFL